MKISFSINILMEKVTANCLNYRINLIKVTEMNSSPYVSIIVPINNAGIYLEKCLDTLVNQTLHNIEIICVLDTPTDGSDLLVKKYATLDQRIKILINEKNLHVAESRNRGMSIASGEYIGFSDHDDWRSLDMYEKLYNAAYKDSLDIVISDSYVVRDNEITVCKYDLPSKKNILASLILPMSHPQNKNFLSKSVWASIYKRTFIIENHIEFLNRNNYYQEDTLFNLDAFLQADKIKYIDEPFYYWNINENSTSSQPTTNIAERQINFFEFIYSKLSRFKLLAEFSMEFNQIISRSININYTSYMNINVQNKVRMSRFINYLTFSDATFQFSSRKKMKFCLFLTQLTFIRYSHTIHKLCIFRNYLP